MTYIEKLLIAGAMGDAMGYLVEFDSTTVIHQRYKGDLTLHRFEQQSSPWMVSDDTQMTLFYLDAMLKNTSVEQAFRCWHDSQSGYPRKAQGLLQYESLWAQRAPGMTCLSALNQKSSLGTIHNRINNSKGCGTIMRTMPSILKETPFQIFEEAVSQSFLTHGHDLGALSSAWCAIILACPYQPIQERLFLAEELSNKFCSLHDMMGAHQEMVNKTQAVLKALSGPLLKHHALTNAFGEGWTADDAYQIALYSALAAPTLEDCLQVSINHNGDSDSTGSVAAQIYISLHPETEIPSHWKDKLDIADAIHYVLSAMQQPGVSF